MECFKAKVLALNFGYLVKIKKTAKDFDRLYRRPKFLADYFT